MCLQRWPQGEPLAKLMISLKFDVQEALSYAQLFLLLMNQQGACYADPWKVQMH